MSRGEIASAIVGVLVIAVIVLSVLRPSSRIRFGVFFERDVDPKDEKEDE